MLDIKKQNQLETQINQTLHVPQQPGTWNPIAWVKNFMEGKDAKALVHLMDRMGKVDAELLGLADTLDKGISSVKTIKAVNTATTELQGLMGELKADASGSLAVLRNATTELRVLLGIGHGTLAGLSYEEKKAKISELLDNLTPQQEKQIKRISSKVDYAIKAAKQPLFDAAAVLNVAESLGSGIKNEALSRNLMMGDPAIQTALNDARTAALNGFTGAITALRAATTRGGNLVTGLVQAAEKAVTEFKSELDSKVGIAQAGPLLAQISDLSDELTATKVNYNKVAVGRVVVVLPPSVKAKLAAKLDSVIPAPERTALKDALDAINDPLKTAAEKAAASTVIRDKFPDMKGKLDEMAKLVDSVCKQYAEIVDSHVVKLRGRKHVPDKNSKELALDSYEPKLKAQVIGEMTLDGDLADIATAEADITTKFASIKSTLKAAFTAKVEAVLGDPAVALGQIGATCGEALKGVLEMLDHEALRKRFPIGDDIVARGKRLDELEADLKKALA